MKHIVNLSGGKDSTAMLLMMLEKQMPIDYIVFADTGKDFPQMLDHLIKLGAYIKENYPSAPKITTLRADKSFDYLMFDHKKTRGKHIGKRGYGWATMWARWCTAQLKTAVIDRFARSLNDDYVHYIGIAADEWQRLIKNTTFDMEIYSNKKGEQKQRAALDKNGCVQNLQYTQPNYRYPLADWKIDEAAALQYCYDYTFDWGGLYTHFDRVSCWCCPLKNLKELKALWRYYPELWAELKDMDARAFNKFRVDYSVEELEERFIAEASEC